MAGWIQPGDTKQDTVPTTPVAPTTPTPTLAKEVKPEVKEVVKASSNAFDFSEETDAGKEIYTFFGLKGSGKTTNALSLPGKILAVSFDKKTTIIKNNMFDNDERIKVFDAMKYFDEDDILKSSEKTFDYILALIEKVSKEFKPDYILFDCAEHLTVVCEMVMRLRNNITAYGGISNQNIWKLRKSLLAKMYNVALTNSNKGLIYTLYTSKDEIINEGTLVSKSDVPKWTGIIATHTDFVLRTKIIYDKEKGKTCFVEVVSSKNDKKLKTGSIINTTDFKNKLINV